MRDDSFNRCYQLITIYRRSDRLGSAELRLSRASSFLRPTTVRIREEQAALFQRSLAPSPLSLRTAAGAVSPMETPGLEEKAMRRFLPPPYFVASPLLDDS